MLPITLGVIGAKKSQSTLQSFLLSVTYVLGIAITYAILGVFAALTGSLFGSLLQNQFVVIAIALIFFFMGLSMFDLFYVQMPVAIQSRLSKLYGGQSKNSFLSVGFMGLISGLIATPCVGPVIVGMLTYVAQTKSIFLGFWLLFTFAIGMGLVLIVFGTFSSRMTNLPKAGTWMEDVKKVMGFMMFGVAIYYLRPLLPELITYISSGILAVITGTFIFGTEKVHFLRRSLGILVIALGLYVFLGTLMVNGLLLPSHTSVVSTKNEPKELVWLKSENEGLQKASQEQKYIMIDFYADWCPACIELDKFTYTDPKVIEALDSFVAIKIDATKIDDNIKSLFKKYGIVGLPAVLFLDSEGKLLSEHTLTGFEKAEDFIKRLDKIKATP